MSSEIPKMRILIIDDNPAIHADFKKILNKTTKSVELARLESELLGQDASADVDDTMLMPDFEIDSADQGQLGVEKIKTALKDGRPYSLAFVDIRMPPGWDGIQTIKHIWELDKDVQIVICTAYSDYSWGEMVTNLGQTDNLLILKKPFDSVSVRQLACALTKKWQLLQAQRVYSATLEEKIKDRTLSLQQSLSLVKATFESSNDGVLVIDNNGHVIDSNQNFMKMWAMTQATMDTKNLDVVLHDMETKLQGNDFFCKNVKLLCDDPACVRIDHIRFKDGKILEYYTQPLRVNNIPVGRIFDFRDISKYITLQDKLQYEATHDHLTDLPNRVLLLDILRASMQKADSNGTSFALLFIDLDRFKLINDSLGHAAGDLLLQMVSKRLSACTRPADAIARLGGDEFIVVMNDIKEDMDVENRANELIEIFRKPFSVSDHDVTVTASVGVSVYPRDGSKIESLIENADSAMYCAKDLKGDNYKIYSSKMCNLSLAKLEREIALRHAIENNEFFLVYQPQFDLKSQAMVAVEALIRWNHPTKGLLLPLEFIPLAEETGMIVPIGEWVLREACKQCKSWHDAGLPKIRVAVNVAVQQFNQQNMVELVRNVLNDVRLRPEYLELEITESVIVNNVDTIRVISKLKDLGVIITLDDFGTGYSSLSYLKNIPLDKLKIDKSFINSIQNADDKDVISQAIISIAKNLKLGVLAEGVETLNQVNFLKLHDCTEVQGFYFSKPLSAVALVKLLKKYPEVKLSQIIS